MDNINKGWLIAIVTSVFLALYTIFLKVASTSIENVNAIVIILQTTIAGSFLLLILAGYGRLSLETLRSSKTWSFGTLQLLSNIFTFAALTYAITATSLTLLARFSIILSIIIALAFEKKKPKVSWIGFIMVMVGISVVALSLDIEFRNIALFWVFLMCLTKVRRSRIIVKHKASNKATGDFRAELRVTGYILAITSCFYALLLFATMLLEFNQYAQYVVPTREEFFALKPLLFAMGIGSVLMAGMRYSEIVSTKHIGATNFLTVMAFTPLFTYMAQLILHYLGEMPFPNTNIYEILGGFLIVTGAVLLTRTATKKEHVVKILPKDNELMIVKDSIAATIVYFKDDLEKVSETLGLTVKKLNEVMEDKSELLKDDMQLIIKRYNENIIGLDYLTGDLNKKAFENKLIELKFFKKSSVLKVNIDSAGDLIEHYGQDIYELIQIEVSNRLAKIIKMPDILAKVSSDEFGIIMYDSNKLCRYLTKRSINKKLNKAFVIDGIYKKLYVNIRIFTI